MALRDLVRSRLALRIYLVGLGQMAAVAAGFAVLLFVNNPGGGPPSEGHARVVAREIGRVVGDPAALALELRRIHEDIDATLTVVDPAGVVVGTSAESGAPRCSDVHGPRRGPGGKRDRRVCRTLPVAFPGGRTGQLELTADAPPRPPSLATSVLPLVLLVVGISSLLLARSLTQPLLKMSTAARAFGAGDLGARVGVERRDELGDVSRSFDDMAARVTDLLRAEKELLANISHELRTPLSRIRVALDLASEGDTEVARESLVDIAGDLDELEALISDVLTAARLDLGDGSSPAGLPPLRRRRVDVRELLSQAESRFRAAHPGRTLNIDVAEDLPAVDGDPVLLRRVVDNLLENAHKYSEGPTDPVDLRARADEQVEIDVVDRGIGIAPDDLARVFRPFFRADKSRTRATGGLGLGLALAKRIVDAHGGSIELGSAPREGTRARVRLPVAPAELGGGTGAAAGGSC